MSDLVAVLNSWRLQWKHPAVLFYLRNLEDFVSKPPRASPYGVRWHCLDGA